MMNDSDSCVGGGRWKRWFCCVDDIGGLFLVVLYFLMTVVLICLIIYLIFSHQMRVGFSTSPSFPRGGT